MSNEMVKRVAKAIYDAENGDPNHPNPHFVEGWKLYERHARAAIEAMREPTEEMVFRGALVASNPLDSKKQARVFSAMVDAALQDDRVSATTAR